MKVETGEKGKTSVINGFLYTVRSFNSILVTALESQEMAPSKFNPHVPQGGQRPPHTCIHAHI